MAAPDLKHVQADEYRIAYRERGTGPALFFVHGMGGDSANWETEYEQFSDRYRVIGWDAPGYGGSDPFDTDLPSVGDYVMAMASFLDALGIDQVHLVGHSYGGIMVTGFHRSFPDRMLSLTLAQPVIGGGAGNPADRDKALKRRTEEIEKLGADGYAKLHAPRSCSPEALPEVVAKGIEVTARLSPKGYLTQFHSLRHANIFEWTSAPAIPALIISGEHDQTAQKQAITDIAAKMPGIHFETILGIGHMIYLEYPERFNALLEDLLAEARDGERRSV